MQLHRYSFQYTIDALCKAGAWLAAFCLLVLALVVSYEVVVRYTTGVSSSWIQEFSVYLMMAVGFLAAAYALQMNSHFAITFFVDKLSPAKRRRLTITTNAVGLCYSLMFVLKGTDMAMAMYALGDTSTGLMQTPLWLPAILVPISGVLLSLQFLSHTIDNIAQGSH